MSFLEARLKNVLSSGSHSLKIQAERSTATISCVLAVAGLLIDGVGRNTKSITRCLMRSGSQIWFQYAPATSKVASHFFIANAWSSMAELVQQTWSQSPLWQITTRSVVRNDQRERRHSQDGKPGLRAVRCCARSEPGSRISS
jgi:hypothetical protein